MRTHHGPNRTAFGACDESCALLGARSCSQPAPSPRAGVLRRVVRTGRAFVGTVVDRMDYGPFGENLRAAIRFPTEQFAQLARDAESGQDYAQARTYSPTTGRFSRVDPVYSGLFEPQKWNRYIYAINGPLSRADPSGLDSECTNYTWNSETQSHHCASSVTYDYDLSNAANETIIVFTTMSGPLWAGGTSGLEGGGGGGQVTDAPSGETLSTVTGIPETIPGPIVNNPVTPYPEKGIGDDPRVPNRLWPSCRNLTVQGDAGRIKFGSDGLGDVTYHIEMNHGAVGVFAIQEHFTRLGDRRRSNAKGTLANPFRKHQTPHGAQYNLQPGSRFVINASFYGVTGEGRLLASGSATCIVP